MIIWNFCSCIVVLSYQIRENSGGVNLLLIEQWIEWYFSMDLKNFSMIIFFTKILKLSKFFILINIITKKHQILYFWKNEKPKFLDFSHLKLFKIFLYVKCCLDWNIYKMEKVFSDEIFFKEIILFNFWHPAPYNRWSNENTNLFFY